MVASDAVRVLLFSYAAFILNTPSPVGAFTVQAAPLANVRTYTPADFERFAPRTALDMLQQLPSFSIREVSEVRGLGQASENVLING